VTITKEEKKERRENDDCFTIFLIVTEKVSKGDELLTENEKKKELEIINIYRYPLCLVMTLLTCQDLLLTTIFSRILEITTCPSISV
jgi:hypothetical protein